MPTIHPQIREAEEISRLKKGTLEDMGQHRKETPMNKNMTTQSADMREENCDAEDGSTTVEYAIGALATAGFAGLLLVVLKSGVVQSALEHLISTALSFS